MIVTQEQLKGMLDRFAAVMATMLLAYFVKRGWIGESESATLLPAVVLLPSLAWGWWVNRNKALQQAAANTISPDGSKPIIVTSPEMAAATPESNIVSSESFKVTGPQGIVMTPQETTKPVAPQVSRFE